MQAIRTFPPISLHIELFSSGISGNNGLPKERYAAVA
jgi:hypothetical protein